MTSDLLFSKREKSQIGVCNYYSMITLAKLSDRNSFRANQNYSDTCIRSNANQFEQIQKTFCISFDDENGKKSIRPNPN